MSHRLVLVRHAQAVDADPRGDHERVLTAQGRADATELGRWLAQQGLRPHHVLVSTAERAQQTWDALRRALGEDTGGADRVWPERRVYDGGTDGVLAAIREVSDAPEVLWVVGHEPVMSGAAGDLAGPRSAGGLVHQVTRGFPTATAAVLEVPGEWAELHTGESRLLALHTGRAEGH
ncbi:SixA phosphatase family protein [Ornithinimicrobium pratense]|uniref:Histidine phosphatase family protein n=1 Tax=Ornithinimicrobium pratense TaxID=2593973 RepID=A0A5J6V1Y4_9MICO|nr:histidine phosphatase family protein [Ornithinimicrobium pratense]QFG67870.1 histidine phosphatase family protein [Ornithinimicrobium pratense]